MLAHFALGRCTNKINVLPWALKQRRSAAFQCRRLTGWSDTTFPLVPSAYTNRPENWLGAWAWILTGFAGQRLYSRNARLSAFSTLLQPRTSSARTWAEFLMSW